MESKQFPFYIEPRLVVRLDRMIKRLEKRDVWIAICGDEGAGKTNMEAYLLYYLSLKTGRPLTIDNFYYDAETLVKKAQVTEEMLYGWDEGAMGGLSTQWMSSSQQVLTQFGMTSRVLHHVVIICIPRFDKLKDYLRDRCCCVIYCSQKGDSFRYIYISEKKKKLMLRAFEKTRRMQFKKYKSFGASIGEVFTKIFSPEEQKRYDLRKKDMISQIGKKPETPNKKSVRVYEAIKRFANLKLAQGLTYREIAKEFGMPDSSFRAWMDSNDPNYLEKQGFEQEQTASIVNDGDDGHG